MEVEILLVLAKFKSLRQIQLNRWLPLFLQYLLQTPILTVVDSALPPPLVLLIPLLLNTAFVRGSHRVMMHCLETCHSLISGVDGLSRDLMLVRHK